MKVAIEGCCHGDLDRIYEVLEKVEEKEGYKIDLLICCGDFQAVRNAEDLSCMAVPLKYRYMQSFYKYYCGEKKAPMLTIFVGGNHEASNHLWELSYGGWVAPNIYYMGNAGVIRYGGLRIAGLSGIYKEFDYRKNRFECPPYDQSTVRSTYHVRSCDVFRMKQLTGKFDIIISHDWPLGIHQYGDTNLLLRIKPFFNEDIQTNTLGSPPAMELLQQLQPTYWFSGHLHVKFAALYPHKSVPAATETDSKQPAETEVPASGEQPMESQSESKELLDKDVEGGGKDEGMGEEKEDKEEEKEKVDEEEKEKVDEKEEKIDDADTSRATSEIEENVAELADRCPDGDGAPLVAEDEKIDESSANVDSSNPGEYTKFLALDKVLPRKRFLQILDIDPSDVVEGKPPYRLEYDQEWLAILKSTESLMKYKEGMWLPPHTLTDARITFTPTEEELQDIQESFSEDSHFYIPENFAVTATCYVEKQIVNYSAVAKARENPQTVEFCEKLGIDNPFNPTVFGVPEITSNPDEIDVGEDEPHTQDSVGDNGETNDAVNRSPLTLPPPSNTLTAEPGTDAAPRDGAKNTDVVAEDVQGDDSKSQSLKRSLADRSPDRMVSQEEKIAVEDVTAETESKESSKQEEPLIKRRNVALYSEDCNAAEVDS